MNLFMTKNKNAASGFVTKWYPMQLTNLDSRDKFYVASSITVVWNDMRFTLNQKPILKIEFSQDSRNPVSAREFAIDSESNSNDILLLLLVEQLKYVRVTYNSEACTEGILNILINYR